MLIGSGAKVLGPFMVGSNSRVAANAVVLKEIPPNSTAVGAPARVVKKEGEKVNFVGEVDQINIDDPVILELIMLRTELEQIKAGLSAG